MTVGQRDPYSDAKIEGLLRSSAAIHLAVGESVAEDISDKLRWAAKEILSLRRQVDELRDASNCRREAIEETRSRIQRDRNSNGVRENQ